MTSLAGMAWGLGLVWLFRIVANKSMGEEALGFGDATLMGMAGAFLGWQSVLLSFFLAPFLGVNIGVFKWLTGGARHIPYGPYLCLGAAAVVVFWLPVWDYCQVTFFLMGWMLPVGIVLSTSIMAAMLLALRFVKYLGRRRQAE
jgi:leader peptidase (prepilin peptidase)/N-methyltransferase